MIDVLTPPFTLPACPCSYGGGRKGLSDTLAGGLWVADALFAFANAGARGFHLHWGKGGTPSGDSQPNTGVQTNFDMKVSGSRDHMRTSSAAQRMPPMHVLRACRCRLVSRRCRGRPCMRPGLATFSGSPQPAAGTASAQTQRLWPPAWTSGTPAPPTSRCGAASKGDAETAVARPRSAVLMTLPLPRCVCGACASQLWALRSDGGEVRVALLNKDEARGCNMELHMEPRFCSSRATLGRLLPGPLGMASKTGITWQGQHYVGATTTGKLQGTRDMSKAPLRQFAGGKCGYVVTLPPASAALLIVQPPDPVML